ncbi:efflux RND transporter periplasmic adaptor subunit [Myxococcota bacterium]|nr:efflux RND transporter periplasmic adaptor subunit [Myxococcota bacterium]
MAPRTESDLIPEVSGRVVWVSPKLVSGGFFDEDEPLLRIDDRDYAAALARAEADVARADSESQHAASELKRQQGLARSKANSRSQLSDALRADRVAQASLKAAQSQLGVAQRDLSRTEIRAPFEGRVRQEDVDVGQFVSRGTPVATLYATDFAEIRLPLADRQLAYLDLPSLHTSAEGVDVPEVRLRARFAGEDHTWRGRIVRTEGEIDNESRMVHVVARVEDPYGSRSLDTESIIEGELESIPQSGSVPLAVGLFVRAEIIGKVAKDVLTVPRVSLRDANTLLVVDETNRLRERRADVLRVDREDVMLRANLQEGDQIIVSPLQVVVDGMEVRTLSNTGESAS